MAITIGSSSNSNQVPNTNFQTLSVNCTDGTDKLLLVVVTMASTVNFSSASYNGVAMTLVSNRNFSGLSQRQAAFVLVNPDSGTNIFRVNFSGSQFNSTSIFAQSFTGANGVGNFITAGGQATPNLETLSVSSGSVIYASGISNNAQSLGYEINGSTRTNKFTHNTNKIVEGALSANNLTGGSVDVNTIADFGNITNGCWEIQSGSTPPPIVRRRMRVV